MFHAILASMIIVTIKDYNTGETREYRDDSEWADEDGLSSFIWTDGNYSCDCNRGLFFCRAKGEDDDQDFPCGDHRFGVSIKLENGEVVYSDLLNRGTG